MSVQLPLVIPQPDELTRPEKIAAKYGFDLKPKIVNGRKVYRLHSWLAGLVDKKYADQAIRDMRRPGALFEQCVDRIHTFEEPDKRNRNQIVEYVTDSLLYDITQDMVIVNERITEVRQYLSDSGAFVDWAERNPQQAATGFQKLADQKHKQIPTTQSKEYLRAIHSGYTPEQAAQTVKLRENLKQQQNITNDIRKEHGAHNGDFARLNAVDSEIATGKTPKEWQQEYGTDKTPSDYHSPIDRAMLFFTKRQAAKLHERNQSYGADELEDDVRSIQDQVDSTRESLTAMLSDEPLQLPAPKAKQTKFLKDGK